MLVRSVAGTKIRTLSRLIDASDAPVWAIDASNELIYLSSGVGSWLDVEPEKLLGQQCVGGASISDDPSSKLAARLAPPPGFLAAGTASYEVTAAASGIARQVRFVRVGPTDEPLVLGIAGDFDDAEPDSELTASEIKDAIQIRKRLDAWRSHQKQIASLLLAGSSRLANRLNRQVDLACRTRCDVLLVGLPGCGSDEIADAVHLRSDQRPEAVVKVDGGLMDIELLDAVLSPVTDLLSDSSDSVATAVISDLEQMPIETQNRLHYWYESHRGRLRLIGMVSSVSEHGLPSHGPPNHGPPVPMESLNSATTDFSSDPGDDFLTDGTNSGLIDSLSDLFSAFSIEVPSLVARVEDIPEIASALLHHQQVVAGVRPDRIGRSAMDAIVTYPWPNNFSELAETIRYAAARAASDSISIEHLPLAVRTYRPADPNQSDSSVFKGEPVKLDDAVGQFEQTLIREAVDAAGGNRAEAARYLGISRARLLRKLDQADG